MNNLVGWRWDVLFIQIVVSDVTATGMLKMNELSYPTHTHDLDDGREKFDKAICFVVYLENRWIVLLCLSSISSLSSHLSGHGPGVVTIQSLYNKKYTVFLFS